MSFQSVAAMFRHRVQDTPDREAFSWPDAAGHWQAISWKQTDERVRRIGAGLRAQGLGDEDRVSILCGTRVEWLLVDLGVMVAGGATTTIYPTTTPDDTAYILSDSGTVIAVVEDQGQVDKVLSIRE